MNKEELLEAIEQKRQAIRPTDTGEMKTGTVPNKIYYLEQGWLNALKWMKDFINSLPTEQQSENLEEYYTKDFLPKEWFAKQGQKTLSEFNFFTASHFAQWQKEQMMKSTIDGCYIKRNRYTQVKVLNGFSTTCEAIQKFKDGDKVKILIIKEDKK